MNVQDLMTPKPFCCYRDTSLMEVAAMMRDHDCGMIPVVESNSAPRPIGAITDRDIVVRCLARSMDPQNCTAQDMMTKNPVTISQDATDHEARDMMANHQIRRLIVVDDNHNVVGVLAQADLARQEPEATVGRVVRDISPPASQHHPRP